MPANNILFSADMVLAGDTRGGRHRACGDIGRTARNDTRGVMRCSSGSAFYKRAAASRIAGENK